jgi:muramoyltetrapeptide carboxypeptidase
METLKVTFTYNIIYMPSNKKQPEYLKPGDEVAIISPSFCIDEKKVTDAVPVLESWGLKVRTGKNAFRSNGPFAGTDEERLSDLQEMTDNPDIKAIICSRGGYGMSKIIDRVDFSALNHNSKWYAGFSDITVLHLWLSEVCGICSIHSDMPLNFNDPGISPSNLSSLRAALFGELKGHSWKGSFHRPAGVTGELTGGNLSLVYSLLGTEAEPSTRGKILFIEEIGEYYYHIDRMLTSLKLAGKLESLAALVIGGMNKMEEARIPWGKSIEETVNELVAEYDYPVFYNFPAGHVNDNRAIYIGRKASIEVNGNEARLNFI